MKKFYSTIGRFYDNGRAIVTLGDVVEAKEKPKNTCKVTARYDLYVDWFESKEDAIEFTKNA